MLLKMLWSLAIIGVMSSVAAQKIAELELSVPGGITQRFIKMENSDMSTEPGLVAFLRLATVACATGIWMFYPKTDFLYDGETGPGYVIGFDELSRCFDISSANGSIGNMLSYRSLGPIVNDAINLDQQSITIYSGEYGSGERITYIAPNDLPAIHIPNNFNAKSFVVTAQHDDQPLQYDNSRSPVFNIIVDPNGDPQLDGSVCISLVNANNVDRLRMHLGRMQYVDNEGVTRPIVMGSIVYFTYQVYLLLPVTCPVLVRLPANNFSPFQEIPVL